MANKKPNILIIWGDDIGWFNVSAYNNGIMGYRTPNIDRVAKEGALFTDWYGQQSCTAGAGTEYIQPEDGSVRKSHRRRHDVLRKMVC
jgi:arylsulfatase A-like enzyme